MSRRRRLTRRQKVWLSVAASVVGTAAFAGLAVLFAGTRDTDLRDPNAGVTKRFAHSIPEDAPPVRFMDVADELGVKFVHATGPRTRHLPEDSGSGLAWGDIDGDGDPDLFCVGYAVPNALYRNDGGAFTDVATAAGVDDPDGRGMGATFADYDADGDLDLHVTAEGPDRLYRNRGDGTFDEVAVAAGIAGSGWTVGVAWGDFDADGHLDLYVCAYLDYIDLGEHAEVEAGPDWASVPAKLNPNAFSAAPNRLYRNLGDGTFEEVAEAHGVNNPRGRSLAAVFCDLDRDGRIDLYVNNDASPNALFLNTGSSDGPRFLDRSALTGTADPRGSMGLSVLDALGPDGAPDGQPDLFITHWVAQENALYEGVVSPSGRLIFKDRTRRQRLGEVSVSEVGWGCAAIDLDLDGRVDLAVVNGSTLEDKTDQTRLVAERPFLLWNDGERFHDLAPEGGDAFTTPHSARGLAAADWDADGDVDLAVNVNRGRLLLLRNDTDVPHRSLTIRLEAPAAVTHGARVSVTTPDGAQTRWWGCDGSYASWHHTDLVFGLGEHETADVHVTWADGTESLLTGANAELTGTDAGLTVVRR